MFSLLFVLILPLLFRRTTSFQPAYYTLVISIILIDVVRCSTRRRKVLGGKYIYDRTPNPRGHIIFCCASRTGIEVRQPSDHHSIHAAYLITHCLVSGLITT